MFRVSCSHPCPDWVLNEVQFADTTKGEWGEYRVSQYGNDELYYASAPRFGCGRNAPSKDRAISSLLLASGVYHVSIREDQ